MDHLLIRFVALALMDQLAVPLESVVFEGLQDCHLRTRDFTWRVQIFHAHQPLPTDGARVEVGSQCRDQ